MDAACLVLVRGGDDFDDFVAREAQRGDLDRRAVHEVGVEDAQDRLVRDDEQVVLLPLELENDGLETHSEIVI